MTDPARTTPATTAAPTSTIPPQLVPGTPPPADEPASAALMCEPEPTAEDWQRYDDAIRNRNATYKAMLITMAVIMAPFIGLLYDIKLAIGLLGVGLAFTTVITWKAAGRSAPAMRPRLKTSAILNGVMALAAFGALAAMLATS
ncbi:MAG: hypothetical protein ACTHQE_11080 [Thermomicrobiales bacterium]